MENNTTHGRKIIRDDMRVKKQKMRERRFAIAILTIDLLLGLWIGVIISSIVHEPTSNNTEITSQDDQTMPYVKRFGTYDDRCFTEEISMDWIVEDDFTPLDCKMDEGTQEFVFYLCDGYNIDWTLVMAMIKKESNFDAGCISSTDDYGLMQINKCNHEWLKETLGITDFLDSKQNIRAGIFVLRKLFEEYTDVNMVLMSYNMGSTSASRLWNEGIYTTSYVDDILTYKVEFENQLKERMK